MSIAGDANSSRRMTRSASKAASSRGGSEEAPSIAGGVPATPARAGQRQRNRGTPAKEAVQTGRDIGNRGSAAYGAKGKPLSGPRISLEDANRSPADVLQAQVEQAQADQARRAARAGNLPAVSEEPVTRHTPSITYGHGTTSGSRAPTPVDNPADQLADTAIDDGNTVLPTGMEEESTIDRSFLQAIRNRFSFWLHRGHGVTQGESGGDTRGTGVQGFEDDWNGSEEGPHVHLSPVALPRHVVWSLRTLLGLLLMIFLFLLDLYRGPLLGPKYDYMRNRIQISPEPYMQHYGAHADGRLGSLEKLVDKLASRSRLGKDVAHEFQQINWFSSGNGAVVEPYLTSPSDTGNCKPATLGSTFSWIKPSTWFIKPHQQCSTFTPSQALRPLSDIDRTFCAPQSRGKLQLTVITPRDIAPTELIIEHPKDALIVKGTTPREFELYAQLNDPAASEDVTTVTNLIDLRPEGSSLQNGREDSFARKSLPDEFTLIGRWNYDLHAPNYIQTFRVPVDLRTLGGKANTFTVRVNTNWGDTHPTCLYRVRLHGHDMSGITETFEPPLFK